MFKGGVGFFALFGLGWLLLGTAAASGALRWAAVAVGAVLAVGLMLAARRVLPDEAGGPMPPAVRKRFGQVNAVQWGVIAVIVVLCGRVLDEPRLIAPLIAVVVGLHFLPLARVFGQPRMRVPGWALVAVGAAGLALRAADAEVAVIGTAVGLGSAAVLWGTCGWTLVAAGRERAG